MVGCSDDDSGNGSDPGLCARSAPEALRQCIVDYSAAIRTCYLDTDSPCPENDAGTAEAIASLQNAVLTDCDDGDFANLSADALTGRLTNACASEASSAAWRTYGGVQGAVWPNVTDADQDCLADAHAAVSQMFDDSLSAINDCLSDDSCDADALEAERETIADATLSEVEGACADMSALIAVDPPTYVDRLDHQIDCITATAHTDTAPLELFCGPSNVDFEGVRGEYVRVVVDGDKWGTMCSDGSPYVFHVRLAPEGEPLDRVLIGLQGGGVCIFEGDCTSRLESNPELFTAMDDEPLDVAIASNDPGVSPFGNWTKVYLPYCNQDVFAGGGVIETLGDLELPRYGAVNLRAAIRMVRGDIGKQMDEEDPAGFRPDELVAFFGGWSAGAYGALYNYHWLLDDLQWPRTAAFPDAGGALDNGSVLGVSGVGLVKIPAWGALQNLPPYCFVGECALGPVAYEAISPRLKQVPEQQYLILSNPKDNTQQGDAFFDEEAFWINTMRQSYCNTKDLPGINYFYTSVSDRSLHVVTLRDELWNTAVDGEVMKDWFARAINEPDTLQSRVEEADFVEAIPGVEPYPCEVAP